MEVNNSKKRISASKKQDVESKKVKAKEPTEKATVKVKPAKAKVAKVKAISKKTEIVAITKVSKVKVAKKPSKANVESAKIAKIDANVPAVPVLKLKPAKAKTSDINVSVKKPIAKIVQLKIVNDGFVNMKNITAKIDGVKADIKKLDATNIMPAQAKVTQIIKKQKRGTNKNVVASLVPQYGTKTSTLYGYNVFYNAMRTIIREIMKDSKKA